MGVRGIESVSVEPYEGGVPFGDAGPYEVVRAVLRFAVDPTADANRVIVNLDRVRGDRDGEVGFDADLVVLRPTDPGTGKRAVLYSVANRGGVASLPFSVGAFAMPGASDRIEAGDAWLLRRGFCVAWSGRQWDVVRRPGMVGLAAPEALGDDGAPVAGDVRVRVQPSTTRPRCGSRASHSTRASRAPAAVPARRGAPSPRARPLALRRPRTRRARRRLRGGAHLRSHVPHGPVPRGGYRPARGT